MFEDIYINDVAGSTIGVVLVTPPPIVSAPERGEWVELPGLDGEVWRDDGGLQDTEIDMELYAWETVDISAVLSWIRGMQRLRWGENAWFYRARVKDTELLAENWEGFIDCGRTIRVAVRVKPYRYRYPEAGMIRAYNGDTVVNPGTAEAAPLIVLNRSSGSGTVQIGDYAIAFMDYPPTLYIDCEARTITDSSGESAAKYVALRDTGKGRWPRLAPGGNTVGLDGASSLDITPRWRDR